MDLAGDVELLIVCADVDFETTGMDFDFCGVFGVTLFPNDNELAER